MTATTQTRSRAAWRAGVPGAIETGVFALSLLTGPLLSRSLGDDGRGSLAAVLVPLQILGWALLLGVPYASAMLTRSISRRKLIDGAWGIAFGVVAPICGLLFFLAPTLLEGQPSSTINWFRIGLFGVVLGVPAATALQIRLITRGPTVAFSLAKSLHLLSYSAAVVVLAVSGRLSLVSALAAWILSFVLAPLVVLLSLGATPHSQPDSALARRLLTGGRMKAVATLATVLLGRIDQVVLSVLASPTELGHYAVAATAAQVSLPFSKGLADFALPRAFRQGDSAVVDRVVGVTFGLSAFIGIVSAVLAPWLIPAVFGEPFEASVPLLLLLLPGQVLFNTGWVVSAQLDGRGRSDRAASGLVAAAAFNLVAVGPAIKLAGPSGAAVLTTLSQALFLLVVLRQRTSSTELDDRP